MTDLSIYRGDTKVYTFTVTSGGSAYNISGFTPTFTVKTSISDADDDAVISKSGTVTDGAGGEFTISLTNTDTDIDPADYVWDVQITNGSTIVATLDKGTFTVKYDVTRTSY